MVFDETNKLMGQPVSWLLTMNMHVHTEGIYFLLILYQNKCYMSWGIWSLKAIEIYQQGYFET